MSLDKESLWECETKTIYKTGKVRIYKDVISHIEVSSELIDYLLECKLTAQEVISVHIKKRKIGNRYGYLTV
jgi:hypothetical protein